MRLAERMVKLKVRPGAVACAWLGQAGYLMKTSGGVTVMIDPYFSDEVERQEGLRRLFPPPITTDEMQPDILFVSHGHLDHFDEPLIRALAAGRRTILLAPPSGAARLEPGILFVSHGHLDHFDEPLIRALAAGRRPMLIAPPSCTARAGQLGWPA